MDVATYEKLVDKAKPGNRMPNAQSRHTPEATMAKGEEIYEQHLRFFVEIPENMGKLIAIEIHTGDYEIAEDSLEAALPLRARHSDPVVSLLRIGYTTTHSMRGGGLKRIVRDSG